MDKYLYMSDRKTALFDLDGVILDTEPQYSEFWHERGIKYLGIDNLESRIKGQTMTTIYDTYFPGMIKEQEEINKELALFERNMQYDYVPAANFFFLELARYRSKMAIVTSSNRQKMENVFRAHPEIKSYVKYILTAELFSRSKPDPECYQFAMNLLNAHPSDTYIFEDSFNGLKAAQATGAHVIGLATTNTRETIQPMCHYVLDNFVNFHYDDMEDIKR